MGNVKQIPNDREAAIMEVLIRGELYGREIRNGYERRTDAEMPLGSLYVTLDRMEAKGFLASRMGESSSERGGNRRKYYKLTGSGISGLNLWRQLQTMPEGEPRHA